MKSPDLDQAQSAPRYVMETLGESRLQPWPQRGHRGMSACAPAASSTTAALLRTQPAPGPSLRRGGNLSEERWDGWMDNL